ncbi:MAG: hypothetical protein Q9183_003101 [Haloplaca sp. 2 TL-2023]
MSNLEFSLSAQIAWSEEESQGEAPRSLFIDEQDAPEEASDDPVEHLTDEELLRGKDLRIRQLHRWSSALPNLTMATVSFTFKTLDKTLEFLSLVLSEDRQVDIGFPNRYALVSFLLQRLEESHFEFLRSSHPEEFRILEMPSADIFELHVWQAYVRRGHLKSAPLDYAVDEAGRCYEFVSSLDYLRQIVEHRPWEFQYNFDSSMIKAAAACASQLGDFKLLEDIDKVVKVLYADADGESAVAMTEQERKAAQDVLWPRNRPVRSVTQLLREVQNIAENACFESCRSRLPITFEDLGVTTAEHLELPAWVSTLRFQPSDSLYRDAELRDKLDFWSGRILRNAAAHRALIISGESLEDRARKIGVYVDSGLDLVEALGDDHAISKIKELKAEVIPLLVQKHEEWLRRDQWETEAFRLHEEVARQRASHWGNLIRDFFKKKNVDIRPIGNWYGELAWRRLSYGPQPDWLPTSTREAEDGDPKDWAATSTPEEEAVVQKQPERSCWPSWLRMAFIGKSSWIVHLKSLKLASKRFGRRGKQRPVAEAES